MPLRPVPLPVTRPTDVGPDDCFFLLNLTFFTLGADARAGAAGELPGASGYKAWRSENHTCGPARPAVGRTALTLGMA
ncbi:hypothetical protein ACFZDJ_10270 [Streptomyces sp. NPDC007896]|uniref:hypothetical protein n=1 Tax=Streptomyces sp. NPDC007896 TaxID=3364784 RepID=UPI0036E2F246